MLGWPGFATGGIFWTAKSPAFWALFLFKIQINIPPLLMACGVSTYFHFYLVFDLPHRTGPSTPPPPCASTPLSKHEDPV